MPRVSQDHKDARREQILKAAERCFVRNGFHETSMQDLFAECGLSSGAVYTYFRSKSEVISAIAEANLNDVVALVDAVAANPRRGLGDAVATLVDALGKNNAQNNLGHLQALVWAEAVRNPDLAVRLREAMERVHAGIEILVSDAQASGQLDGDLDTRSVARLLSGLLPGSLLQIVFLGEQPMNGAADAARGLWPA